MPNHHTSHHTSHHTLSEDLTAGIALSYFYNHLDPNPRDPNPGIGLFTR